MDRRIIEGIEACRPGTDDLQSPELSDVARRVQYDPDAQRQYERVQAWDALVSAAVEEVAIPSGLAERIVAQLPASASVSPASIHETPPRTRLRRRWLTIGSAIAACLMFAALLGQWLPRPAEASLDTMAEGWIQELSKSWQAIERAPRDFVVPTAVTATRIGWQRIGRHNTPRGVAYKLAHPNAGTATLFVVQLTASGLPNNPPIAPQSTTGGKAIGYWHSGTCVYVLVVEGGERSYHRFVSSSPMPLA